MKRPTYLLLLGFAGVAAVFFFVLFKAFRAPAPEGDPVVTGPGWSDFALPRRPFSSVDTLKRKARAGNDPFVVETVHEKIGPRLDRLAEFFRAPDRIEALAEIVAESFRASSLQPDRTIATHAQPGSGAFRGEGFGGDDQDRELFIASFRAMVEPLTALDRAELKVVRVDPGSTPLAVRILFQFAGAGVQDGQARRQWNGEAKLTWRRDDWRLLGWETTTWFHSRLDARPFEDVTARALGSNPSYRDLVRRSIDDFRVEIDAASGIDVYGHHGLAVGDADGDGLDDLYVSMPPGLPNLLYRSRGDGTFEDVSAKSGSDLLDGTSQTLFLDIDNDGDEDLFLVTESGLAVLSNRGDGKYEPLPAAIDDATLGAATPLSIAAADYDLDGHVDVYVASYVLWRGTTGAVGSSLPLPYHDARNGAPNLLLRNRGGSSFENVTEAAGLNVANDRFSFAASWGDADGDGDPDLYVANDFGANNFYLNRGDGSFLDVAAERGVDDVGPGMSVAWRDYDNDGDLDLYVGNLFTSAGQRVTGASDYKQADPRLQSLLRRHTRGNSLLRNRGDGMFEDVSVSSRTTLGRWSWAADFVDFNLDGHEDIYVQNGFVTQPRVHDL